MAAAGGRGANAAQGVHSLQNLMVTQPPLGCLTCSRSAYGVIYHHAKQVCYKRYGVHVHSTHPKRASSVLSPRGVTGIQEGSGE